jgi:uridine phosphorylase
MPEGVMWTTDRLITDPEEIAALRERGVVALDMETAAIAAACERRDIPWSVFRVISDRATDGSVDEEVFHLSNQDGTPDDAAIELYFSQHPERVEAMARLAEGAMLGAQAAADAAIAACGLG